MSGVMREVLCPCLTLDGTLMGQIKGKVWYDQHTMDHRLINNISRRISRRYNIIFFHTRWILHVWASIMDKFHKKQRLLHKKKVPDSLMKGGSNLKKVISGLWGWVMEYLIEPELRTLVTLLVNRKFKIERTCHLSAWLWPLQISWSPWSSEKSKTRQVAGCRWLPTPSHCYVFVLLYGHSFREWWQLTFRWRRGDHPEGLEQFWGQTLH